MSWLSGAVTLMQTVPAPQQVCEWFSGYLYLCPQPLVLISDSYQTTIYWVCSLWGTCTREFISSVHSDVVPHLFPSHRWEHWSWKESGLVPRLPEWWQPGALWFFMVATASEGGFSSPLLPGFTLHSRHSLLLIVTFVNLPSIWVHPSLLGNVLI